jgi:4-oxalocrotonate tautomerase
MPLVQVTMREGRTAEQVRALISALTAAVVDTVGTSKESVRVIITEVPPTHWAAGDVTLAERAQGNG